MSPQMQPACLSQTPNLYIQTKLMIFHTALNKQTKGIEQSLPNRIFHIQTLDL